MSKPNRTRREFLKTTSATVAAAAVGSAARGQTSRPAMDPAKIRNYKPKMGYRRLGKTELVLSEISLGGHGTPYKLSDEDKIKNRQEVLARAVEAGINYLDTNIIHECELYGKALGRDRDKFHIGFASWPERQTTDGEKDLSVESMTANIEGRLKDYGTDMLDIWRPVGATWGPGQLKHETMLEISPRVLDMVVQVFEKMNKQGKVRHLGVSAHNPKVFRRVLNDYPQFSVIYFPYLFLTKEQGGDSLLALAKKKDVGVIGIKPFAAGKIFLSKPKPIEGDVDERAASLLKIMLTEQRVTAIIPGMSTVDHLAVNVRASYERDKPIDKKDLEALRSCNESFHAHLPAEYQWLHHWRQV